MKQPFFFNIDVVGRCNLACPSCPQGNNPHRLLKAFMEPALLNKILLKATSEAVVFGVGLFNWGEPFTHPRLDDMVRVVHDYDLLCYLSSNLNSVNRLEEVLRQEPHSLRISCSGFTQEIYSRTHARGDIAKVKEHMRQVSFLKSDKTKVHMLWHQYRRNAAEEPLMREFCESLGFEFATVPAYYMPLESVLEIWRGARPLPAIDSNLYTGLMEHKQLCANRSMPCRNQTQEITIDALGRVQLCCGVYDSSKFTLCDFLSTPLSDVQAARLNHSFCDSCIRNGGHIYVSGHSHRNESLARKSAKAVYRRIAPIVPTAVLRMML